MRRACVLALVLTFSWSALAARKHYDDEQCALSFDYSAGWSVQKKPDEECAFTILPDDVRRRAEREGGRG
jgi:hypothetical protein